MRYVSRGFCYAMVCYLQKRNDMVDDRSRGIQTVRHVHVLLVNVDFLTCTYSLYLSFQRDFNLISAYANGSSEMNCSLERRRPFRVPRAIGCLFKLVVSR